MRTIIDMDNIQIEITNACHLDCSNCTRFCGHAKKPFMMSEEQFRKAVDATIGYPKMVGVMGGEPLLHPKFAQFCEILADKFPRMQCGLWTSLPPGKEKYAELICKVFGNIFVNDHSRPDIYHAPILIGIQELVKDKSDIWNPIDKCWVQNSWSASINPHGAYFCEIAAALSILFDEEEDAWPVEPGWWKRTPGIDFREQMERFCPRCGMAAPLSRRRSVDGKDDISPLNAKALEGKSRKLAANKCVIGLGQLVQQPQQMAAYKDNTYRNLIASRYGMHLTINERNYWEPHMGVLSKKNLFDQFVDEMPTVRRLTA